MEAKVLNLNTLSIKSIIDILNDDGICKIKNNKNMSIEEFRTFCKRFLTIVKLLPNDPVRSNLRDENMNPVMGAFGSITTNKIDFQIIDCFVFTIDADDNFEWTYKTKEDCEDPSVTHNVCKWYNNKSIDFYTCYTSNFYDKKTKTCGCNFRCFSFIRTSL